jgi:hypothetical protein
VLSGKLYAVVPWEGTSSRDSKQSKIGDLVAAVDGGNPLLLRESKNVSHRENGV